MDAFMPAFYKRRWTTNLLLRIEVCDDGALATLCQEVEARIAAEDVRPDVQRPESALRSFRLLCKVQAGWVRPREGLQGA